MTQRGVAWLVLAVVGGVTLAAGVVMAAEVVSPYRVVETAAGPEIKESPTDKIPEIRRSLEPAPDAVEGMALFAETEPNDTAATANALPGTEAVVYGTISPATELDYFSFTANAGDHVSAATMTSFSNGGSTDTIVDIVDVDGVTVLETDDDNGSFSSTSSAISGTVIPASGTYYVKVDGFSGTSTITPYHLHVRILSGSPAAETEPNNDPTTANPLPASGWMSGTITATTDPDFFSLALAAGESVYLTLDMDPDRAPANTNWNGRLGFGIFGDTATPLILVVNDSSTTKPHAEAMFYTVKEAGTYYVYVDSTSATGLGADARYHLSVRVIPKQVQSDCTVIASSDVPVTIGPDVGTVTSVVTVPGTVTSSLNDVNLLLDLTHANMPDLDVTLTSPAGTTINLFTDIGSSTQLEMDLGLDDEAALPIGTYTAVKGMINEPEGGTTGGRLASFDGQPATGTWTLSLADDTSNSLGGTLNNWSLEVCGDPPPAYALTLTKTVGLDPAVCATTSTLTAPPGATVYYCYTVTNTGLNTLATHDLVDDQLGTIFTGFAYDLTPGSSLDTVTAGLTLSAVVNATVTNNAVWTGYGATGGVASDVASATVTVPTACASGYQDVTLAFSDFVDPFPPAGWTVANTSSGCNPPGLPDWTNTNPGARSNLTGGAGPFAIADSDRCGSGSILDTTLTTPALDLTGLTDPRVYFHTDYDDIGAGGDQAVLEVSTDGGGTWSAVLTWDEDHRGPLAVEQAIPGEGINGVLVQWHYVNGTYDWWWQVDDALVTACIEVPPPNIDVSPLTLDATQPTNTVTGQVLTIANTGGSDLTWDITEDLDRPSELVDWSDNFDAYATGSQLHGQGGWKGWANDPLAGALTSSAQSRSAPNSVDIVGASDLVHEYAETDGVWTYTAWQFIPDGFTGTSYFILLNQYDDAGATNNWSTQVQFDSATNTVINDGPAGGTLPLTLGVWVEISVEIDLIADTQAFYYGGALLFSGSWSDGNSGGGSTSIAAVDLFANGATSVFYDDMSLVQSVVAVCSTVNDIPWLSTSATAGTTPPAGSTPLDVIYDSTGLADGVYTANLCVASDDPDPGPGNGTDLVVLPVTLTVETAAPGISLVKTVGTTAGVCAATSAITVDYGTTVYYCYEVTNTGNVELNLHDLADDQLGPIFTGFAYALAPGASIDTVTAGVTISAVMTATTTNIGTWTAYNDGPVDIAIATAEATVTVNGPPDIDVSPLSLVSGQLANTTTQQILTIGNVGESDLVWTLDEEPVEAVTPVQQPPVDPVDPATALEWERTGDDQLAPTVSGGRDALAAARAKRRLLAVGLLLIPDSTNDRVMAFDPITGDLVDENFIPSDPTNLSTPKCAILSPAGTSVLVADQIDDVVQEYDLDGNYIGVYAPAGGVNTAILDNILGIDLRPNGNLLVPVDSGTNQDSVAEFDTASAYLGNFVANGAGGLDSPFDVYPRTADWLVTSINSDNVLSFDLTGASLGVFAPGVSFGEQIAGASNGNVLVANFSTPNSGVMEFTAAGVYVATHAAVTGNRGVYELPNGNILTTNGSGVHEIDRAGNLVATKYSVTGAQYIEYVAPAVGCTAPADVPWLSEVPTNGTTAAAGSTPVQVTFDSTGLAVGIYEANLCVFSNDPDEPVVLVPVTLDVVIPVELQSFSIE